MNVSSAVPKVAVVGSGPAGLGVLAGLLDRLPNAEVTLFDHGAAPEQPSPAADPTRAAAAVQYKEIYREIWVSQKRMFPPPKTHFSRALPKYEIDGNGRIFRSEALGGLSNYWGGTCLPFTDRELRGWPVSRAVLDPHYQAMAECIGISGRRDALTEYFGAEYCNRPAIHLTALSNKLEHSINSAVAGKEFKVVAGINRCSLETRPDQHNSCIQCGECLAGCVRDSIYSSRQTVARWIACGRIKHVRVKVRRFDSARRSLEIDGPSGAVTAGPFDRIYLAAGCPNTTEITMRSLGLQATAPMADNAVYVFPILYFGARQADADDAHLSLTNLILGLLPQKSELHFAQAQVYTNFDYMWRYNTPPSLWPMLRPLVQWSRSRLFWGRLYMHGEASQSYRVSLHDDKLAFDFAGSADVPAAKSAMGLLRTALNSNGFFVPSAPLVHQKSNTHYAATLPYGGSLVSMPGDAQIAPGIFVTDSSVFPTLPAVSLTFTIMANARRIAMESL